MLGTYFAMSPNPFLGLRAMPSEGLSAVEAGALIRRRREEKGMTQEQLAEKLAIRSPNYVSRLEKGATNVARSKYFGALVRSLSLTREDIRLINPDAVVDAVLPQNEFVIVRIPVHESGTTVSVDPKTHAVYVSEDLAKRRLEGLSMDRQYVQGVPAGFFVIYSDRKPEVGELVVIEQDGAKYPAFLLKNGSVEVDYTISVDLPLRFKPDSILGVVEEVRMREVPRRN